MDKDTIAALMSSKETTYETPDDLFDFLNGLFHFKQDVCATEDNAKLDNFISPEQDAFTTDWQSPFFMNPPYGRAENECKPMCIKKKCARRGYHLSERLPGVGEWVDRAAQFGGADGGLGVCLLPSRTAERWVQTMFNDASAIVFIRGRLRFEGAPSCAPFPSIVCVFGFLEPSFEVFASELKKIGNVVIPDEGVIPYEPRTKP